MKRYSRATRAVLEVVNLLTDEELLELQVEVFVRASRARERILARDRPPILGLGGRAARGLYAVPSPEQRDLATLTREPNGVA